jgi:hypothetical protein
MQDDVPYVIYWYPAEGGHQPEQATQLPKSKHSALCNIDGWSCHGIVNPVAFQLSWIDRT